jgi:lipoprotein-anchoring transpeptidase ErfK/SrfK
LALATALLGALLLACGSTPAPAPSITIEAPVVTPSPAPTPVPDTKPTGAPALGRWIEVDVTRYVVRLMDGSRTIREIGPVGVGREVDTGRFESTQTGVFKVYEKRAERTYDAPYDTYIAWWVGFDPEKFNGFHSFLLDAQGKVADASTGHISNGCIRTGDAQAVYEFSELGMPVWVHA